MWIWRVLIDSCPRDHRAWHLLRRSSGRQSGHSEPATALHHARRHHPWHPPQPDGHARQRSLDQRRQHLHRPHRDRAQHRATLYADQGMIDIAFSGELCYNFLEFQDIITASM